MFKYFLPEITGIDPENVNADITDYFDHVYAEGHRDAFDAAFSICALHFIAPKELKQQFYDFAKTIKPGGVGFVSLNAARFIERNQYKVVETITEIDNIVRNINLDLIVVDQCYDHPDNPNWFNNPIDGNIRIVFQK